MSDDAEVERVTHAICPHIKKWMDDRVSAVSPPECKKCPATFGSGDRTGKQFCRLLAEQAARAAIAALRPAPPAQDALVEARAEIARQDIERAAREIAREVAELPDRDSPSFNSDYMLVTADELILICEHAIEDLHRIVAAPSSSVEKAREAVIEAARHVSDMFNGDASDEWRADALSALCKSLATLSSLTPGEKAGS